MLYLDTSALLKLYVHEAGSELVNGLVVGQEAPLPIWEIQEFEWTNALRLKVFRNEYTEKQVERQIELFQDRRVRGQYYYPQFHRSALAKSFHDLSRFTVKTGCRTLDVLHVACAVTIQASAFLTFDHRQASLACEAGLKTPIETKEI